MPAATGAQPAERLRARQVVLWTTFTGLLILGLVLYFRDARLVAPMWDAVVER